MGVITNLVYAFIWAFTKKWVIWYHIVLNILVLISAIIHFHGVNKIVKLLNCCGTNNQPNFRHKFYGSVRYAKNWIVVSLAMGIFLFAASIANIVISLELIFGAQNVSFNHQIAVCVCRSSILITYSLALLVWIYQHKETWCQLESDSVCVRYGCDLFIMFFYDVCNCCSKYVEDRPARGRLLKIHNAVAINAKPNTDTSVMAKSETQFTTVQSRKVDDTHNKLLTITKFSRQSNLQVY